MRMNDKESYILDVKDILTMYKDYDCSYSFVHVPGRMLPSLKPTGECWEIILQFKGTTRSGHKLMYNTQQARDEDYERLASDFEANKVG